MVILVFRTFNDGLQASWSHIDRLIDAAHAFGLLRRIVVRLLEAQLGWAVELHELCLQLDAVRANDQ